MAPDIANPYAVATQHLEHPVPERQEEESTFPKKKRKRNVRHIEATDSGFLKKDRMQYRIDNGSESLVTQHKEQRTCAVSKPRCTSQFKGLKGGEELAMLQRRGLVQVLVFLNKDPTPDKHCVFYNGSELLKWL